MSLTFLCVFCWIFISVFRAAKCNCALLNSFAFNLLGILRVCLEMDNLKILLCKIPFFSFPKSSESYIQVIDWIVSGETVKHLNAESYRKNWAIWRNHKNSPGIIQNSRISKIYFQNALCDMATHWELSCLL